MPKRPITLAPVRAAIERQTEAPADLPRGARANQAEQDAAARQRIFAQEWADRLLPPKR